MSNDQQIRELVGSGLVWNPSNAPINREFDEQLLKSFLCYLVPNGLNHWWTVLWFWDGAFVSGFSPFDDSGPTSEGRVVPWCRGVGAQQQRWNHETLKGLSLESSHSNSMSCVGLIILSCLYLMQSTARLRFFTMNQSGHSHEIKSIPRPNHQRPGRFTLNFARCKHTLIYSIWYSLWIYLYTYLYTMIPAFMYLY